MPLEHHHPHFDQFVFVCLNIAKNWWFVRQFDIFFYQYLAMTRQEIQIGNQKADSLPKAKNTCTHQGDSLDILEDKIQSFQKVCLSS